MLNRDARLSPGSAHSEEERRRLIVDFWNQLRACDETGLTDWETLEPLERQVTDCLKREPPDYDLAESLTAKADLLMAGQTDN